jgi:hypothetical protein
VKNNARGTRVTVSADGRGLVSQAGAVLLWETMRVTGLASGLSAGLERWRAPRAVHDPGKVIADLAAALALGGDCLAGIAHAEPRHRYGNSRTVTPRRQHRCRAAIANPASCLRNYTVEPAVTWHPADGYPILAAPGQHWHMDPMPARNHQLRSGLRATSKVRRLQPVKRIRVFAAVVALALSGGIGMAAATAPTAAAAATTIARASLPAAAAVSVPAVQPQHSLVSTASFCPIVSGTFRTYGANCARQGSFLCGGGNTRSINPPAYVSNGCSTRVWLYQYNSLTGRTLCISPRSGTNRLGHTYRAFWVSRNTDRCS